MESRNDFLESEDGWGSSVSRSRLLCGPAELGTALCSFDTSSCVCHILAISPQVHKCSVEASPAIRLPLERGGETS